MLELTQSKVQALIFSSFLIICWPSEILSIIMGFNYLFSENLSQFYMPSSVLISWCRNPISFCPEISNSHSISLNPKFSFPQTQLTHINIMPFAKSQNHRRAYSSSTFALPLPSSKSPHPTDSSFIIFNLTCILLHDNIPISFITYYVALEKSTSHFPVSFSSIPSTSGFLRKALLSLFYLLSYVKSP